jgi:hypothetical protein
MIKIAICVEGQTEQIFVERLVKEVMGKQHLIIENYQDKGKLGIKLINRFGARDSGLLRMKNIMPKYRPNYLWNSLILS